MGGQRDDQLGDGERRAGVVVDGAGELRADRGGDPDERDGELVLGVPVGHRAERERDADPGLLVPEDPGIVSRKQDGLLLGQHDVWDQPHHRGAGGDRDPAGRAGGVLRGRALRGAEVGLQDRQPGGDHRPPRSSRFSMSRTATRSSRSRSRSRRSEGRRRADGSVVSTAGTYPTTAIYTSSGTNLVLNFSGFVALNITSQPGAWRTPLPANSNFGTGYTYMEEVVENLQYVCTNVSGVQHCLTPPHTRYPGCPTAASRPPLRPYRSLAQTDLGCALWETIIEQEVEYDLPVVHAREPVHLQHHGGRHRRVLWHHGGVGELLLHDGREGQRRPVRMVVMKV